MKRIEELDYLKCVFILLMIAFHLVYIGDTYRYAKHLVYTFHMPGFLVISGYLFNVNKPLRPFLRGILWLFIPYAVMESGYVLAASVLPVREHIDNLTLPLLVNKLFLNPLGPYWYLHTLMACGLLYYFSMRLKAVCGFLPFLVFPAVAYVLPLCGVSLSFANACYFLAGMVIRQYARDFLHVFLIKPWTVLPVIFIACVPAWLDKSHPAGILLVYFVMCFLLFICRHTPQTLRRRMIFIGRNTLPLLLFSPLFTILAKLYQPFLLRLEPTGMLFLTVSVAIATAGSLGIAWTADRLGVSHWFFGREKVIN